MNLADDLENVVKTMIAEGVGYDEGIQRLEAQYIRQVLIGCRGNQVAAARELGMHRNTLSRSIAEYKIDMDKILRLCGKEPTGARAHKEKRIA
jgi:Fis family transcriptional regulator